MDRYQRRVLKLRNHVLNREPTKNNLTEQFTMADKEEYHTIAYDEVTKTDIEQLLTEKDIDYNNRNTKQELYDLLLGSD